MWLGDYVNDDLPVKVETNVSTLVLGGVATRYALHNNLEREYPNMPNLR